MALASPTHLSTTSDTSNDATITSASISPTGGALLVIGGTSFAATQSVSTVTDSFTGTGTWTIRQASQTGGSPSRESVGFIAYAVLGSTPGGGTVTVTFSSSSRDKTLGVIEVTGQDTTTPVPQWQSNTGTGASLIVTLDSTPASTSMVIGCVGDRGTNNPVNGSGFTEISQQATDDVVHDMQYDLTNADTTCDWTSFLGGAANAAIAIEVAEQAAGASSIMNQMQSSNLGSDLYNGTLIG